MTGHTLGGKLVLPVGVRAFQVMVLRSAVAATADIGHLLKARRRSAVSTVACGAVRRPKILVVEQGMAVDTLLVEIELIGGNLVRSHQLLVGVTLGAHGGHVGRIDAGSRVIGPEDFVATVTIETGRYILIPFGQAQAVNTFSIFGILIGGQVELAHPGHIGMTPGAQSGDVGLGRYTDIAGLK